MPGIKLTASHAQYFDRVYQFAFSAVDRIASAPKPSLIILQNKCGQSSQLNVDVRITFSCIVVRRARSEH